MLLALEITVVPEKLLLMQKFTSFSLDNIFIFNSVRDDVKKPVL